MLSAMNRRAGGNGYDVIPEHPLDRLLPLRNKSTRSKTYDNWPKNSTVSEMDLVEDGFYYMGMNDKVQCAYCGGVLSGFVQGDDVHEEHARHFPNCPFVLKDIVEDCPFLFNHTLEDCDVEEDAVPKDDPNESDRGFEFGNNTQSNTRPVQFPNLKFPSKSTYTKRLESYKNWPSNHFLKPEDLASAGLFYKEEDDKCQCYVCGGILEAWETGDVPADEHKRWFPKCNNN